MNEQVRYEDVKVNVAVALILCLITFGIYYIFWQHRQMKSWNLILGYAKYSFWMWFLLTLITFGIYHVYHEYVMTEDLLSFQRARGRPVKEHLPVLCVVLTAFAMPFIADAIQQFELHKLFQEGQHSF